MLVPRFTRPSTSVLIAVLAATLVGPTAKAQEASEFRRGWEAGSPATLAGELMIQVVDDFDNRLSQRIHTLRDERTGKTFQLRFEAPAPQHLRSGSRVTVQGRATDQEIYLAAADGSITQDAESSSLSTANVVTGDQTTLVIVAHFRDKLVNPLLPGGDCSIGAISDRMFSSPLDKSVDDMYREGSHGAVSFSGSVVGPFTIDASSTDACNTKAWADAADAEAMLTGVNPSDFPRKVYVMPSNTCPAAGIAQFAVTPSRAWVFTCDRPRVYAHELGHNLGMDHASTGQDEYGDISDVMGMPDGLASFNAPHRRQMGWVPDSHSQLVTLDGTYTIAPLARDPATANGPNIIRVPRAGSTESYYLSYRTAGGFESSACCQFLDRLSVHRWADSSPRTYLLGTVGDGETFVDPATGFSVTQLSHDTEGASALVQLGTACSAAAPSLTLSPKDQAGAAGASASYTLTVANNDTAGCAVGSFALSGVLPSGWTGSVSPSALQLAPGTTGSATWTVTSDATTPANTYAISAYAADSASPLHSGSATGSYTVSAFDTLPPTAPQALAAKVKARRVGLSWQAAADNVAVEGYRLFRDGVVLTTVPGTSWIDATAVSGQTYAYVVIAYDHAGNSSDPSNSVLVQLSGGGGRGR